MVNGDSKVIRPIEDSSLGAVKPSSKIPPNRLMCARAFLRLRHRLLLAIIFSVILPLSASQSQAQMAGAQMGPEAGSESYGTGPMAAPSPSNNEMPPPIANLHIPQPVRGSMIASPPFGTAPLAVGFFVLAQDPEGLGFLTYSWNFGDGTVSSLPPELYIAHIFHKPGNYVVELTTTTVDGRKNTFFQGIIVQPAAH
jgi:PKD domain-containing protein